MVEGGGRIGRLKEETRRRMRARYRAIVQTRCHRPAPRFSPSGQVSKLEEPKRASVTSEFRAIQMPADEHQGAWGYEGTPGPQQHTSMSEPRFAVEEIRRAAWERQAHRVSGEVGGRPRWVGVGACERGGAHRGPRAVPRGTKGNRGSCTVLLGSDSNSDDEGHICAFCGRSSASNPTC